MSLHDQLLRRDDEPVFLRPLPSTRIIEHLTDQLIAVLHHEFQDFGLAPADFPLTNLASVTQSIAEKTSEIRDALQQQVAIAFQVRKAPDTSKEIVQVFLEFLQQMREILECDIVAALNNDPAAEMPEEILLSYPGYRAITIYRLAHVLSTLRTPLIPRMMTEYAHRITGIDIHPDAHIGRSFFIDHGTGVVIGQTTEIGQRVTLYQGVTLGAKNFQRDADGELVRGGKRHPTIEDDVTIYANATILGGETRIGSHSIVGANVTVTDSVLPRSIVTNSKSKLVIRDRTDIAMDE